MLTKHLFFGRRIFSQAFPLTIATSALSIISSGLLLALPLLAAPFVTRILSQGNGSQRDGNILILLICVVMWFAVSSIGQLFAAKLGDSLGGDLRIKIFRAALIWNKAESHAGTVSKLYGDVSKLQSGSGMILRTIPAALMQLIGSIVLMLLINIHLSLVTLLSVALITTFFVFSETIIHRKYNLLYNSDLDLHTYSAEIISQGTLVRRFSAQLSELNLFNTLLKDYLIKAKSLRVFQALTRVSILTIMAAFGLGIIWYASQIVLSGSSNSTEIISFFSLFGIASGGYIQLADALSELNFSVVSLDRIDAFTSPCDEALQVEESNDFRLASNYENPEIVLSGLTVGYFQNGAYQPVLQELSLEIKPGDLIVIRGASGSGKSSLARTLCQEQKALSGTVYFRKVDQTCKTSWDSLAKRCIYVGHEEVLLTRTLEENIFLAENPNCNHTIQNLIDMVQMTDHVDKLECGKSANVQFPGNSFSAGQRQRLAIARALSISPEILILDEATASLDVPTELALLEACRSSFPRMAIIVVSHRDSSSRIAQKIWEVKDGKVHVIKDSSNKTGALPSIITKSFHVKT